MHNTFSVIKKPTVAVDFATKPLRGWFCFLSAIDGQSHPMVSMPFTANGDGVCHDILRQRHARYAGIADVMQVCPGHLAPKSNLTDGGGIGAFLGGADGGHQQRAAAVDIPGQFAYV